MASAIDLIDKSRLKQQLTRRWLPHVKGNSLHVLLYIFDRTIEWGRADCVIGIREFCTGLSKGHTVGTGLSERTVHHCLRKLEAWGMIRKEAAPGRRSRYSINWDWVAAMLPTRKERAPAKPKETRQPAQAQGGLPPRKDKPPTPAKSAVKPPETPATFAGHSKVSNTGRVSPTATPAASQAGSENNPPETTPKERVERIVRLDESKARVRAEQGKISDKLKDLQRVYYTACREHFPNDPVIAWSPQARGMFKHAINNRVFGDVTPGDFMSWVVEFWPLLRNTTFAYLKGGGAPVHPEPEFVARMLYRLTSAYASRETLRAERDLIGKERRERMARRKGFNADEVSEQIAAADKLASMVSKDEHERVKRELAQKQREADNYREQARQAHNDKRKPSLKDF